MVMIVIGILEVSSRVRGGLKGSSSVIPAPEPESIQINFRPLRSEAGSIRGIHLYRFPLFRQGRTGCGNDNTCRPVGTGPAGNLRIPLGVG